MNAPVNVAPSFAASKYQQRFFDWVETGRGSAILKAVAGSGKTTSVIKALPLIPETKHVKLLAFNSIIAKELNARLDVLREETRRPFQNFSASTFHSLGYGAVRKFLSNLTIRMDGGKLRTLLPAVCSCDEEAEVYGDFVCQLVSLAKGQGVGALAPDLAAAWWELIRHHDLFLSTETATEERAVELARLLLARSEAEARKGWIDFDDQLYLVVKWKLRLWQQDWVCVDEAQDTNPVRRALVRLALRPNGRAVFVGDPKQAIYGFAGASHDAMDVLKREFNAVELPLTVCYRCGTAIVERAKPLVPYLEAAPGAAAGEVRENVALADALKELGPGDAVLCRQTAPLVKLAYALIARGVGCAVLGKEIGAGLANLVKKQKARGLDNLIEKLDRYRDREVARFTARGEESKAEAVSDRVECVLVVAGALAETERTVPKLLEKIEGMFSDTAGVLTLSTVHKAKGREWQRVAILRPDLMPSRWARSEHALEQERNLEYVAITRARRLLLVLDPREETK
jgi:ATP-dependent DNA helicase UvrD/PcrA